MRFFNKPKERMTAPMEQQQTIKQPPIFFHETQEMISRLESILQMPLIVYWNSSVGGAICQTDVMAFYEIFKKIGRNKQIALFVKSLGGDVESALRIVNIIRNYNEQVVALIPLGSASSGTLIALGANEIHMGPLAYLTPIDSSKIHPLAPVDPVNNNKVRVAHDELQRVTKLWQHKDCDKESQFYEALYKYVHPLVIGSLNRSSSLSVKVCQEILSFHIDDKDKCTFISETLNNDFPSHSYPIMLNEAKRLGLNAKALDMGVHDLLLHLNDYYSQMGNKTFTDFDEYHYHDNQIVNILEANGIQMYFQNDRDWRYIKEERRWQAMNDQSYWHRNVMKDRQMEHSIVYIS